MKEESNEFSTLAGELCTTKLPFYCP